MPKQKTIVGPALIWKRIAAFFIDIVIINLVVLIPFRSLFKNIMPKNYSFSEAYAILSSASYSGYITAISIIVSIFIILYFFILERKMAQTIGKKLMNLYVVSDTGHMKTWQVLVRNLAFLPIFPLILLWLLDPLFMFFSKSNQRLTEVLSRTRVVEKYNFDPSTINVG